MENSNGIVMTRAMATYIDEVKHILTIDERSEVLDNCDDRRLFQIDNEGVITASDRITLIGHYISENRKFRIKILNKENKLTFLSCFKIYQEGAERTSMFKYFLCTVLGIIPVIFLLYIRIKAAIDFKEKALKDGEDEKEDLNGLLDENKKRIEEIYKSLRIDEGITSYDLGIVISKIISKGMIVNQEKMDKSYIENSIIEANNAFNGISHFVTVQRVVSHQIP